jgi:hypothetical protein
MIYQNQIDQYTGCLLGGAVGDALGWPLEFTDKRDRQELRAGRDQKFNNRDQSISLFSGSHPTLTNAILIDNFGRQKKQTAKGKTPVLRLPAKRMSLNMISALTNQGKVRFMIYRENMTAQVLITFMQRLVKDAPRKVFLILDNLKVHHAKLVQEWLVEHREQIEVFYLPSYSPELNPDEYLNCDLKDGVHLARACFR